jgi:endoglycosylceramidase
VTRQLRYWLASLLLVSAVTVAGCGDDDGDSSPAAELPLLHATRGAAPGIFDDLGRQVVLRGVNLNVIGDYYQASPELPAVLPYRAEYFTEMAAQGFNVVRLLIHWSALEPERDRIDRAYLETIRTAIRDAEAAGVYVVLDMHQDAWGKYIATPAGTVCPPGSEPAIGWDGAPEWATLTDGGTTCRRGSREFADAVINAFRNFYDDTDGIQGQLVKTWAAVAREFAGETAVAGYDLLNEPHFVDVNDLRFAPALGAFYSRTIDAIRGAERAAGGNEHIVFFEPLVNFPGVGSTPEADFTADTNIVFAPHNYAESINSFFTIEGQFRNIRRAASRYQTTWWIGEYGWFGDPAEAAPRVARYGQQEDLDATGGAWWQWVQACGDPHALSGAVAAGKFEPGIEDAPDEQIQYHRMFCPDESYSEPIPEFRTVLARPRPFAAPGRILSLRSDGAAGTMRLEGDAAGAAAGAQLEIWAPERAGLVPDLIGAGDVSVTAVAGGHHLRSAVSGSYVVELVWSPAP